MVSNSKYINETISYDKSSTLLSLDLVHGKSSKKQFETQIERLFNHILNLMYKGMIDLSLINDFIMIINKNKDIRSLTITLTELLSKKLRSTKKDLKKGHKLEDYYHLVNFYIFIMIFTLNIESKDLLIGLFKKGTEFSYQFFKSAKRSFVYENQREIVKILNFFNSTEYGSLFLKHDSKTIYEQYIKYKIGKYQKLTKSDMKFQSTDYSLLIKTIINLDISYNSIFNDRIICNEEDKPLLRVLLCQSLIRILFSSELKKNYEKLIFPIGEDDYEKLIITNLVTKCMYYYYNIFGNKTSCLFRREEIHDDLLKNILFMFGHSLFNNIYVILENETLFKQENTVNCHVKSKNKYESKEKVLDKTDFIKFFYLFIDELTKRIPYLIKLILYSIYKKVLDIYEVNTLEPVYVFLFFNFLFNPKVQEMNGYYVSSFEILRDVNLIINNICFGKKFKQEDKLSFFNDSIDELNKDLNECFKSIFQSLNEEGQVIDFDCEDEDFFHKKRSTLKMKRSIFYREVYINDLKKPSQLFMFDCNLVERIFNVSCKKGSSCKEENFVVVYNSALEKEYKI